MKSKRAKMEPRTPTSTVRVHVWGKMNLTRKTKKRNVVTVNPSEVRSRLYAIRDRKVARTLFQESGSAKKADLAARDLVAYDLKRRMIDMATRVNPAQKGRKPGPGSVNVPISTVRA
jgi:hypothetical protein